MMKMYEQYIHDVQNGIEIVCKEVKLAIDRHLLDVKMSKYKKFDYVFDEEKADKSIELCGKLRHSAGDFMGHTFRIQPFQAFILAMLFGWVKKSDGLRRFIRSYLSLARKNGKTEFMAAVMVLMFLFTGENRANVFSAATQKEQALECFEAAQIMLEYVAAESPNYFGKCLDSIKNSVTDLRTKSSMRPLSTDRGKFDGKNIHCSVVDEYHAHSNSRLLDVLSSSTGSRSQPLTAIITTAGFDRLSACGKLERVYKDVLSGKLNEDRTFVMIFTLDEEDEEVLSKMESKKFDKKELFRIAKKANPCMGVSLYEDIFMADFVTALNQGGPKWIEFLTKKMNVWTNQFSLWISPAIIKSRGYDYTLEDLAGRQCFAALDLASRRDVASLGLYFPYEDEAHRTLGYNFVPEDGAKERAARDRVKYLDWVREGRLIATDGNITDYKYIRQKLNDINEVVDIEEIAYDRFNSSQLIIDLQDDGFSCFGFGQGFVSMNAPTKDIDELYRDKEHVRIMHNNDPVLEWAFSNVTIKIDPAGNWKVDKGKSRDIVDPVVAQIMARGQYMDWRKRNQDVDLGVTKVF